MVIQGYLLPNEVKKLSSYLPEITKHVEPEEDELFPIFCDRVRRSARAKAALITLYDSL
jgi:hypothetical protein